MREIKFRAFWLGKMWEVWRIEWSPTTGGISNLSLRIPETGENQYWFSGHLNLTNEPDPGLLEITGLKDKNGVEIYEGDILATEQLDPNCGHGVWTRDEWGFGAVEIDGANGARVTNGFWLEWDEGSVESVFDISFVFVIGNIHQNPELLEAKP